MTILEEMMDLLKDKELTSLEIASILDISKVNCASYLNTLYNDGRVERTNDKRPFKYQLAQTPKSLLKQLYNLMNEKMDFKKLPDKDDIELIKSIELVIKYE